MAIKNYLLANKKIKIQTEDGQSYYLGKPNDINEMDIRRLRSGFDALIFNSCRVLPLRRKEHIKVVVRGRPMSFWMSPSEIVSITTKEN